MLCSLGLGFVRGVAREAWVPFGDTTWHDRYLSPPHTKQPEVPQHLSHLYFSMSIASGALLGYVGRANRVLESRRTRQSCGAAISIEGRKLNGHYYDRTML